MAAGKKKKKALAAPKVNATSASALKRTSGVGSEARTSGDSPQPSVSKRKADELSNSDCPSEPASRRPASGHLFDDGPEAQGTTGEIAAQSSRQLGPTEGGLAYATVVAGVASPQQPSGQHKSTTKGAVLTEPAASSEAAASLSKTCPDRCVACLMAPLHTPKWPLTVSPPQLSGKTRPSSTSQESRTRAAS